MTAWNQNTPEPSLTAKIILIACLLTGLLSAACLATGRQPVSLDTYEDGSITVYVAEAPILSACLPFQPCDY